MKTTLHLHRRHTPKCKGGHKAFSRSTESDERARAWKKCSCVIQVSGTLAGVHERVSTHETTWEAAQAVADKYAAAGSWSASLDRAELALGNIATVTSDDDDSDPSGSGKPSLARELSKLKNPSGANPANPSGAKPSEIDLAANAFVQYHIDGKSAFSTIKKYRLLMGKLKRYSQDRGLWELAQFTPLEVSAMRASWDLARSTQDKNMEVYKAFFGYCLKMRWIASNPVPLMIEGPKNRASRMANDHEAKEPFTDQEIALMYATAKGRYGKEVYLKSVDERVIEFSSGAKLTKGYDMVVDISKYRHSVTGEDLCDFIAVALWTGLRISDVATFHIDRLLPSGKVRLRPLKTGHKWVEILIPGWLENRIRERARIHGPLIFGKHETDDLDTITDQWRRKLIRLWKLCGLQGRSPKPHPHRFRHTFARIQLQHGLSPAEVAHILGNTEVIVIKHYSTWVREHQEKLDASMRRALSSFEGHDALVIPSA